MTEVEGEGLDIAAGGIIRGETGKGESEGISDAGTTEVGGCIVTVVVWEQNEIDSDEPSTLSPSNRMSWLSGTVWEGGEDVTGAELEGAVGSGRNSLVRRWGGLRISLDACEEGVVFVLIRPLSARNHSPY